MRSWQSAENVALIIILLLAVAICGCISDSPSAKIGNGSFVFIEYHDSLRSKVIDGNITAPIVLDDPLYLYDDKNRTIWFLFSASEVRSRSCLKALYGETVDCPVLGEPVTWGTAQFYMVDNVPASTGGMPFGSAGIVINDIKDDGMVSLLYRNTNITLKPGESWTGMWSDQQLNTSGGAVLGLDRSENITNHGIFNFSQIRP